MAKPIPISINVSDYEVRRSREELAGFGSLDAKRPTAWEQYGYTTDLTFDQLRRAYERGGPGHGAVHRILDKCWQERPRIKQPEADEPTKWETDLGKLLNSINGWQKLRDFDRRNMVGRYAALIYRVADNLDLDQPLTRAAKLVDLVPVFEDQIKVAAWVDDQQAENFGQPAMYEYRSRPPRNVDTQAQPERWVKVHPSRVQILAEGSVGDMFDGVPLLRAGFNNLVDLEKIGGGSAESFLKNSARTVVFEYDKDAAVQAITRQNADGTTSTVREVHSEQTRQLNRNQDSSIVLQGGKANTLQTAISDPTGAFQLAANLFAASVQVPMTILFGAQTGRLASDEDKADMIARCKSRQINDLTPMLEQVVRRLQAAGLVPASEFEVEWPPLDAPGDKEKAEVLGKLTGAAQQAFQAGLTEPLFDANELRGVMGFEPRTDDGMPTEEDRRREEQALKDQLAADDAKAAAAKKPAPKA